VHSVHMFQSRHNIAIRAIAALRSTGAGAGPPAPEAGRFVDVEDERGQRITFGEWCIGPDGY
jgi:hypothetical protein